MTTKFKITVDINLEFTEEETEWYEKTGEEERERALHLTKLEIEKEVYSLVSPGMAKAEVTATVEEVTE